MTMGEAYFRGFLKTKYPSNQEEYDKPGYIVKDEEDCECWIPSEPFEKAYSCAETYIDRMLIEESDLNEKIEKLGAFIDSDKFECLSAQKKNLLRAQYAAMISYRWILVERIRVEQEELKRLMGEPDCGRTCDCGTDCGHKCQKGGSSQAESAG